MLLVLIIRRNLSRQSWSQQMIKYDTIAWMKKRFNDKAKVEYLISPTELQKHKDLEDLFRKFDSQRTGAIEVKELHEMLTKNGIMIDKERLNSLFEEVRPRKKGKLNLDEFKNFSLSSKANEGKHSQ